MAQIANGKVVSEGTGFKDGAKGFIHHLAGRDPDWQRRFPLGSAFYTGGTVMKKLQNWSRHLLWPSFTLLVLVLGLRAYLLLKPNPQLFPMKGDSFELAGLQPLKDQRTPISSDTTIVVVFNTNCGVCKTLMPVWTWLDESLAASHSRSELTIMGLCGNSLNDVRKTQKEQGYEFPIYVDTSGEFLKDHNIRWVPPLIWVHAGRVERAVPAEEGTDLLVRSVQEIVTRSYQHKDLIPGSLSVDTNQLVPYYETQTPNTPTPPYLRYVGRTSDRNLFIDTRNKILYSGQCEGAAAREFSLPLEHLKLDTTVVQRIADACLTASGRIVIAEGNGGRLQEMDPATAGHLRTINTPITSISSIAAWEDNGTTRFLITGYFDRRRVHLVDTDGRVRRSVVDDPRYSDNPPRLMISSDNVQTEKSRAAYVDPVTSEIIILDDGLSVYNSIKVSQGQVPGYFDPMIFDPSAFDSSDDAKRAFASRITPLLSAILLPSDHVLLEIRLSIGNFTHYLLDLNAATTTFTEVNIPGRLLAVTRDNELLVDFSDTEAIRVSSIDLEVLTSNSGY